MSPTMKASVPAIRIDQESTAPSTRHRASRSGKESDNQGYANDNEDDNAELESIEEQVESDSLSNRSEEDEESRDSSAPPSTSSSQSRPTPAILGGWSNASSRVKSKQIPSLPSSRSISLLLNSRKESSPRSYNLYVIQHPNTGAECGSLFSRIPLAPPLFVQLVVRDVSGKVIPADDDLPFLVTAISLHKVDSHDAGNLSSNNELNGTTVAGPSNLRDMQNNRGIFFIFPDVGVRRCGRWKLHIKLLRLALLGVQSLLVNGDAGQCIASTWTDFFEIKPQQTYVAPKITPLTRHFIRQGVQMFISSSVVPG